MLQINIFTKIAKKVSSKSFMPAGFRFEMSNILSHRQVNRVTFDVLN